jgi:hypothetical protein
MKPVPWNVVNLYRISCQAQWTKYGSDQLMFWPADEWMPQLYWMQRLMMCVCTIDSCHGSFEFTLHPYDLSLLGSVLISFKLYLGMCSGHLFQGPPDEAVGRAFPQSSLHVPPTWSSLKLKLSYDWQSVGQSVLVSGSQLEPMIRFFFTVRQLRVSWCGAPSLISGWVCNSLVQQLLLGIAIVVTLVSKSRKTCDYFTVSSETPPTWGARSPYLYPAGTGWPSYTPIHWVPFSTPLMTRRARLEVF